MSARRGAPTRAQAVRDGILGHTKSGSDALAALDRLLAALADMERLRDEAQKWAYTMKHERDWETQVVHSELLGRAEAAEARADTLQRERDEAVQVAAMLRATEQVALREARARADTLQTALKRAAYVAEHLMQMIDRETWRASGGDDGQGHYEGDYREARLTQEIKEWAALAGGGE